MKPLQTGRAETPRLRVRGFSLLELLIAVLVVAVGLTGTALLMATAIKSSDSGYMRSQATILAYEITERMRANRGRSSDALSALGGAYDAVTLCETGGRHARDGRACQFGAYSGITGSNVKTEDLRAWWTDLQASDLTNWYAGVARAAGSKYVTVAVQWDDSRAKPDQVNAVGNRPSCLDDAAMPIQMEQVCVTTQL